MTPTETQALKDHLATLPPEARERLETLEQQFVQFLMDHPKHRAGSLNDARTRLIIIHDYNRSN